MFHQNQDDRSSLEAATEAAAKVNAMLIAKGMLKPNQIHGGPNVITKKAGGPNSLVVAEVEINNLTTACRNTLTRGTTQEEISKASGAAVTTRGRYIAQDEQVRHPRDRCLYLNVQASTQESVDIAVQKINEIIKNMCGSKLENRGRGMNHRGGRGMRHPYRPTAPLNRTGPRNQPPPPPLMSLPTPPPPVQMPIPSQPPPPPPQTVTILQEKLYVGLEHAPPNFDTKNRLLGPEGSYTNHIQLETGAAVSLRGKGSGFLDMTGADTIEPMHIHIEHQTLEGLQEAKKLAENLIQTVQQQYVSFQQALAALPASVPTGLITGVRQQPPYVEQQLVPPPLAPVPQPQMQSLQPQIQQLGPPPMMLPASSVPNQIPSMHQAFQNTAPGAPMVIPSSLTLTQLPLVNTLPASAPSVLPPQPNPIDQQQAAPQLILSQPHQQAPPPAPQLVQPPQTGPPQQLQAPPPQMQHGGIYTSVQQPHIQLVSQPVVSVVQPPGPQPVLASGPPSAPLAQPQPQPQPLSLLMGPPPIPQHPYSASTSVVYTVASTTGVPYYSSPKIEEVPKRRFTEEKDEGVPDNVLGYQHGPPHLVNLVQSSPPPSSQAPPQPLPGQHVIQIAAPPPEQPQFAHMAAQQAIMAAGGQPQPQPPPQGVPPVPHFQHPQVATPHAPQQLLAPPPQPHLMGPPPPIGPNHSPTAHHLQPQPMDIRFQVPASSSAALMPPPPPPSPLSSQAGVKEEDGRCSVPISKSPETPWESRHRGASPSPFEPDKKKIRGILKNRNSSSSGSETDKEVAELTADNGNNGGPPSQEESCETKEGDEKVPHHQPPSPQYQGQPLRYPSMPSDPYLPPTSIHEQIQHPQPLLPPSHLPPPQLRPLHPGHPHLIPQPEQPGQVLVPPQPPHIQLIEGPRPELPPGTPQIVLEHTSLPPPPGVHIAQPHHHHLAGPPPQRPVLLEQHQVVGQPPEQLTAAHLTTGPPHTQQEFLELEIQQQPPPPPQVVSAPPPAQFHHVEQHLSVVSQASQQEQHLLPPGSAVMVSSGQHFPPQYSVAISSATAVPPPPPPPQSYALPTSGPPPTGVPLAIHSGPQQMLAGPPPPPAPPVVSTYNVGAPPPPISSYALGVPPPMPPTSSPQYAAGLQLQPQQLYQPQPTPTLVAPSSQYQPIPQSQPTIPYWLSQAQ